MQKANQYMTEQEKVNGLLIQWLEEFKSMFGNYPEAQPTIQEVEAALSQYKEVVGRVKIPLDIKRAKDARRQDGSILEYGLQWQLDRFLGDVWEIPVFFLSHTPNS